MNETLSETERNETNSRSELNATLFITYPTPSAISRDIFASVVFPKTVSTERGRRTRKEPNMCIYCGVVLSFSAIDVDFLFVSVLKLREEC